jgi:hypothetical protein
MAEARNHREICWRFSPVLLHFLSGVFLFLASCSVSFASADCTVSIFSMKNQISCHSPSNGLG